jgi:hypothetical protein
MVPKQTTEMQTYTAQHTTPQCKEEPTKHNKSVPQEVVITVALNSGDIQLAEVKHNFLFFGNTPATYLFCI